MNIFKTKAQKEAPVKEFIPYVVSWNTTKKCNLRCKHCYLDADFLDGKRKDELTTDQGIALIDEISALNPNAVLIFTGGEPLLREDIFTLTKYASGKGLMAVLGTNGTLINESMVKEIQKNGINGIGVSIDSLRPEIHDKFRGLPGSLDKVIRGLKIAKAADLEFQIQTTVTRDNFQEIPEIIDLSYKLGCRVFNLFFLVCTGRGHGLTDITAEQYEEALTNLVKAQEEYKGRMLIKGKCAPHFKRIAYQMYPDSLALKGYTSDCLAARNYCRVTSEGDLTFCPYMPQSVGNVKTEGLINLWKNAPVFKDIRAGELKEKCNKCEFKVICGGCRARAFATTGDYLKDDPWCNYEPKEGAKLITIEEKEKYWVEEKPELVWNPEAKAHLQKIPFFARNMVVKAVEKKMAEQGLKEVTLEIMKTLKRPH